MNFTDLTSLKNSLETAISGSKLLLTQHFLPEGSLSDWIQTLSGATLTIKSPTLENSNAKTLTLSGAFDDSWSIPHISGGTVSLGNVTCTFTQNNPGEKIQAALSFSDLNMKLGSETYMLSGTVGTDGKLKLDLDGQGGKVSLSEIAKTFSAGSSSSIIGPELEIFKSISLETLSATVTFGDNSSTSFTLSLEIGKTWKIVDDGKLSIANPVISIQTELENNGEGGVLCQASYMLKGDLTIKNVVFGISMAFSGRDDWSLTVSPKNTGKLPSLEGLAEYLGGAGLKNTVSTALSALPVSSPSVQSVRILFSPFEKKIKALSIRGSLQFLDGTIQFTGSLPDFSLSASLLQSSSSSAGSVIHLKPLFQQYFGNSLVVPDIQVSELSFLASPKAGSYSFSIAIDELMTLPVGQNHLSLDEVELSISKAGENVDGNILGAFTLGGVSFSTSANYDSEGGWTFEGHTVKGGISLISFTNGLLDFFGTQLPSSLPDIEINNLAVSFNTSTKNFTFTAETSTEIEIPFLTGEDAKIHAQVNLQSTVDSATGNRQLSGFMEGDFTIGTSEFTLQYSLGKESHVFEASWESTTESDLLGINTILEKIGVSHDVSIPPKLDLNLKKVYLQYQAERETLKLVADSASYGEVFLIVSKLPIGQPHPDENVPDPGTADWQFVFGWNYANTSKLSAVPGIGTHFKPADILHFESLGIIISSADIKQFEIPDMPGMKKLTNGVDASTQNTSQNGAISTSRKPVAQGSTIPLGKGLAFVAVLDMGKSDQTGSMPALRTIVPDPTLTVLTAINLQKKAFSIMALLDGSVTIPTGGKSDLRIGNAALAFIFNDGPAFQISGELAMHFDHETINVDPKLTIMVEGIEFQVDVVFKDGWKKAMGIPGLTLDEVGFELGVDFIPPGVNIGLEGQSHIGKQPKSSDNFAFVLEVIEEVPDPLLLSFYLKEIDIPTAMTVFVPEQKQPSLPAFVKQIKMTEVSFYWAQEPVPLPDGNIAQPGLRFGGNLQILSFQAYAALAIDQTSGIAGEFEMSPVHFHNILSITGKGQGVYLNKKNGKVLPVKVKPDKDQTGIEKVEIVAPGGPVFAFRTTQSPYLQVSIEVSFLDLLHEEIEALVQNDGIYFKLEYDIGSLVRAELDFTLSKTGFTAHSYFGLHLKADIGPIKILGIDFGTIHLDTGFDIELYVTASLDKFEFSVNGEFDFEGARLHFPELKLEFAPKSLEELPKLIVEHIIHNADEIFKDLFDAAGKLIAEGVKEVEHLAEEAGKEVAKLATEAEEEAEKIVGEAAKAVEHTVEEAAAEVKKIEQEAEQVLTDAKDEVVKIGKEAEEEVEKIGTEIVHVAEEAEKEVEEIGKEIAQEAKVVAKAVAKLASEAVAEVKAIAAAVAEEVSKVLDEAKKVADAVVDAAKKVVNELEDEAKALWDEAKKLAKAIEDAAKKVGHAIEHTAKKVWHAISKY